MSAKAIWNLNAKRSELGHATKGQIYLSKIGIGFAAAVPLWFVYLGDRTNMLFAAIAVFITSKICWHVNTKTWQFGWDSVADWICDGVLHCSWFAAWCLWSGDWRVALGMLVGWAATYAHSSE